jgi:outer membrane protein
MKLITLFATTILLFSTPVAFAGKTVVFNPQIAILGSDAAKKRNDELNADKDFAALVAKTENLRAELIALQKDAEKNGMTWGADQQAEHKKKMTYLGEDFQLAQKKAQAEQNAAVAKLMQESEAKLTPILKAYMEEMDIDIVIHSQATVIFKPVADITNDITERLNKAK